MSTHVRARSVVRADSTLAPGSGPRSRRARAWVIGFGCAAALGCGAVVVGDASPVFAQTTTTEAPTTTTTAPSLLSVAQDSSDKLELAGGLLVFLSAAALPVVWVKGAA